MSTLTQAHVTINLQAIADNYRAVAAQVAPAKAGAVVKANAYGLGADIVASALEKIGCTRFFVAQLQEAASLRTAIGDDSDIYILNGLVPSDEELCSKIGAVPVLNSLAQIRRWAEFARNNAAPLRAALQIDSGMSRLGLSHGDISELLDNRDLLGNLNIVLLMSHLACADEQDAEFNTHQHAKFLSFCAQFPNVPRSLANSGGCFLPQQPLEVVRTGIALYGGAPHTGPNPMKPVVALSAPILQIREVPAGTGVGYGLTHVTQGVTRIATIALGYADGWPRQLSNRGKAYFGDTPLPIIGNVSMDSITLNVSDVPADQLREGMMVELIGPHQSLDQVAHDAGTISYEILTQLGPRYNRDYLPLRVAPRAKLSQRTSA